MAKPEVPYHSLMVLVGMLLDKEYKIITRKSLQHELALHQDVGFNIPFDVCQEVLDLLEMGNFIKKCGAEPFNDSFMWAYRRVD